MQNHWSLLQTAPSTEIPIGHHRIHKVAYILGSSLKTQAIADSYIYSQFIQVLHGKVDEYSEYITAHHTLNSHCIFKVYLKTKTLYILYIDQLLKNYVYRTMRMYYENR